MSRTPYPPTDYTAVLSAKRGLTTEFGMGSGVPSPPWLSTKFVKILIDRDGRIFFKHKPHGLLVLVS